MKPCCESLMMRMLMEALSMEINFSIAPATAHWIFKFPFSFHQFCVPYQLVAWFCIQAPLCVPVPSAFFGRLSQWCLPARNLMEVAFSKVVHTSCSKGMSRREKRNNNCKMVLVCAAVHFYRTCGLWFHFAVLQMQMRTSSGFAPLLIQVPIRHPWITCSTAGCGATQGSDYSFGENASCIETRQSVFVRLSLPCFPCLQNELCCSALKPRTIPKSSRFGQDRQMQKVVDSESLEVVLCLGTARLGEKSNPLFCCWKKFILDNFKPVTSKPTTKILAWTNMIWILLTLK